MLIKENDEKNTLINLEEYYSNFFYKNQKFKKTFKNKLLSIREYFAENPITLFLTELAIGIICFGFPTIFLFYFSRSLKSELNDNVNDNKIVHAFIPLILVITVTLIILIIIIFLKIKKIFRSGFQFPSWERFHLGKSLHLLIKLMFLIYFLLNFISYLNYVSDDIFKTNLNNLNPLKSMTSKILYYNIFGKKDFYLDGFNVKLGLNNSQIIEKEIDHINKTYGLSNNSMIKSFLFNIKESDLKLKNFIVGILYPGILYCFYAILRNLIFNVKHSYYFLVFALTLIFENFTIICINEYNKFTYWIQVLPILICSGIFLFFNTKRFLKFNKLSKIKNNLNHSSLSNVCKYSIFSIYIILIFSILLALYSFFKFLEEQIKPDTYRDDTINIFNSRNTSFIAFNLFVISYTYFIGEAVIRLIFYAIEKEFFPLRKPCKNHIILNQKPYHYLKYDISDSDKFSDK